MSVIFDQIGTAGSQFSGMLVAGLLVVSCSTPAVPSSPDVALGHTASVAASVSAPGRGSVRSLEAEVVDLINEYRSRKHRRALRRHAGLAGLARRHSEDMLRKRHMSHDGFSKRAEAGTKQYGLVWMAENVMWGGGYADSEIAQMIVTGWIESKEHRKNLLYSNREIGVGIVRGADGTVWATQLSARERY